MRFKSFYIQIIYRLVLLFIALFGLNHYLFIEVNYIRVFFLSIASLVIIIWIFRYMQEIFKDMQLFLQAIIHNDFSVKFQESKYGKTYGRLYEDINKVNQKFVDLTQKDAGEYQYVTTLIDQLQVGILALDKKDRVHLMNNAFKELLELNELINLKQLEGIHPTLHETINSLKPKENTVIKLSIENRIKRFSVNINFFRLRQKDYRIISIQDINNELSINEMEAWQKLIRVLTHEIMNSVAPISSLSGSLESIVNNSENLTQDKQTLSEGLDAISHRSQGLMNFTDAYRKLTRIPLPNLQEIQVDKFFTRIESLFKVGLTDELRFAVDIENKSGALLIDIDLMEQVLINLLKNAKEAMDGKGVLVLSYELSQTKQLIKVKDNGPGIPESAQDKIFIPFFTTKESGSGIGLSLTQQIVRLHNGKLTYETSSNGTTFSIEL